MTTTRTAPVRTALLAAALLAAATGCTGSGGAPEPPPASAPPASVPDGGSDAGADGRTDGAEDADTGRVRWEGGVRLDVDTYQDLDEQPSGGRGFASSSDPAADLRVRLRQLDFVSGAVTASWSGPPELPGRSVCSALLQPLSVQQTVPLPDGAVWCFRTAQGRYGFLKVQRVDLHAVTLDVTVWEGTSG
ncbi:hypothetical protein [Kitasatospora phosalacinea]|uniref:Lipoprotein n=1 Tax=Kitasatospora phosalacinea TaxID=2065 RepID=A0A9W6PIE8_9ACTN|nr:hypothetical protein [Kitasatospora phosalacinea]GLW56754.1 hypothetical protein Kpho01_47650 [Kitasatospora phosalacinea]